MINDLRKSIRRYSLVLESILLPLKKPRSFNWILLKIGFE